MLALSNTKYRHFISLALGLIFVAVANLDREVSTSLSDSALKNIKGAFVFQDPGGPPVAVACLNFFMSEEFTGQCDSPWEDENDTCLAEACSDADESCSTAHRRWTNVPINVYYMLAGENQHFHLKLNPVECWVSTECITRPIDEETTCLNPGPDFNSAMAIADPEIQVQGVSVDPGIPCQIPELEPEGCRKCEPRLNIQLGDYRHLANQPEVEDCPFGF